MTDHKDPAAVLKNLERLHAYGHFDEGIAEDDLANLDIDGPECKAAVHSYQAMFSEKLDTLTQRDEVHGGHRRPSMADGLYGPATAALLELPRCGQSDFMPVVANGQARAIPDQCKMEITTSYKPGMTLQGLSQDEWQDIWIESNQNLMDAVECRLTFNPGEYPNTIFYAFPARLPGSVLADHVLGRSCQPHQGRYDSNRTWSSAMAVAVASHEKCHGLGVAHTNASNALMNPFIHEESMRRRGALIEPDIQMLERVGFQRKKTDPDPEPPGNQFITGELVVHTDAGNTVFIMSGTSMGGSEA